jgi:hypothetical protein
MPKPPRKFPPPPRTYVTTETEIEDMLIEEREVLCLDPYSYGLTLSIALARVCRELPLKAKVKKGYADPAPKAGPRLVTRGEYRA